MLLAKLSSPLKSFNGRHLPTAVFGLAIFAVTFLAYFPAWYGGQLWDDPAHLTAPALQSWHGLWQIWFQLGATQQYYPVLHSAFWLEHRGWGDAVLGYHLVNVGLHATAACLFAVVLARLRLPTSGLIPRWRTEWLAAAIFALHPVCVESVAWMTEQKNTLSLVFYLLAALAYLRFDRERRKAWYALALGLFVLALLSKSVTATLPAALLLMFYWRRGRLSWTRDILPLLPWFVIGAASGLFTAWVEHQYIGAKGAAFDLSLVQRCFLAGRAIWFYLGKLVWPAELIFVYPRWQVAVTWGWSIGLLGCVGVLGGLWCWRARSRAPLVAALFFVGSLFPVLGFFNVYPFVFSYVADHWQYLPCLGLIALAAEGAVAGLRSRIGRLAGRSRTAVTGAGASVAGLLLVGLFSLTWRQAGIYRDVETLYSDTLAKNPDSWLAHNNLGLFQLESGAVGASIGHFRTAVRLKPDCADAFNNLGNALAKIPGHAAESLAAFEQALRYDPEMPEAHGNFGWALVNTPGRLSEGIAHLRTAIRLRPELFRVHNSLGIALTKLPAGGPEAIFEFETALHYDPDYVAPRINLGNALVAAGRVEEGLVQLGWAQQLSPKDATVPYNLGTALAGADRPAEAAAAFERALQLQPDYAEAHTNLGNVLSQLGHDSAAIEHYRTSLRINPKSAEAHFNLGRVLRSVGDGSEAIFHYREALRLAPGAADIWNSFGSLLLRYERLDEGVAAYREAVGLRPDSAVFRNNLGIALTGSGHIEEAIGQLKIALKLNPQFADAHYNLGVALLQAGRADEAAAEFAASGRAP